MKITIQIVRLFLASNVLFSLGSTQALSCDSLSQEETYKIPLRYYCEPSEMKYGGIDFVAIVASNKKGFFQEFSTGKWEAGKVLGLQDYQTDEPRFLTITKRMLPLELIVMPIWLTNLPKFQEARKNNLRDKRFPKPRLAELGKVWRNPNTNLIFCIDEKDLFDEKDKFINTSEILIKCSDPFSIEDYCIDFY